MPFLKYSAMKYAVTYFGYITRNPIHHISDGSMCHDAVMPATIDLLRNCVVNSVSNNLCVCVYFSA
jgi:hypothetical protein